MTADSRAFAHQLVDLLFDQVDRIAERPVVKWTAAAELRDLVALGGPPLAQIELARLVADYSIQLHHPKYLGHQVCPPMLDAAVADLLISVLNNSTAVWEMSPISTMIEKEVIRWLAALAGYPETAEGTAVSGGSAANLTALLAARARWLARESGRRPVILTSGDAHYSIARAAGIMGVGEVLKVETDAGHRMDVRALGELLERHAGSVLAIVATAGSTATGAFDPLEAIADLRDRHDTWLHVDAAHGASVLLSERFAHLVRGLSRADSLSWDPHKMMWMPLSLGTVLVRDGRWLRRAFATDAPYLFHAERAGDNIGEITIQCSKRADAVKLWLMLRSRGTAPFAAAIERVADLTRYLYERLRASADFEPVHEPDLNILCFHRRGLTGEQTNALRERLIRTGNAWITSTVLKGERVLRVTMMNPRTTEGDVDELMEELLSC